MKAKDIEQGKYYFALVDGKLTLVVVEAICTGVACPTRYNVLNTKTGASMVFKSAARFRSLAAGLSSDKKERKHGV